MNAEKAAECIDCAESEYNKAQQAILKEFKSVGEKYTQVPESFADLGQEVREAKIEQDVCHVQTQHAFGSMMEILLNINCLAVGEKLTPLTQEQVNKIMTQPNDPRNCAPGTDNTTSSPADLNNNGGRKK
jgi:hypothetical protein